MLYQAPKVHMRMLRFALIGLNVLIEICPARLRDSRFALVHVCQVNTICLIWYVFTTAFLQVL